MASESVPSSGRTSRAAANYPEPFTVPPASGIHKETFVILHGRGDNGENFGPQLLLTRIPEFDCLPNAFPNAKFVFPTASKRRARAVNNCTVNQWFDIWSLVDPDERDELQHEGLRESLEYVCGLLKGAIGEVGGPNTVLWGLSQGSATMLLSLLHWSGEPFVAAIGMCGWLPLRKRMLQASLVGPAEKDEDNPFSNLDDGVSVPDHLEHAIACLREILDVSAVSEGEQPVCRQIPVFLGHGVLDEKVAVDLGRQASAFLDLVGLDVRWHEYQRLLHWYSGEMLQNIVHFLVERCGFTVG